MPHASIINRILFAIFLSWPYLAMSQAEENRGDSDEETYYVGINPIAPFTSIRSEFTSLYLPILSSHETGLAVFVGKTWNRNYNVETRLSYGSPRYSYKLFQVHSGFNYVFNTRKRTLQPYAGLFMKIYSLQDTNIEKDRVSAIAYFCAGNRFMSGRFFIDLRINQNIYAISWANSPGSKATSGFHPSIYKWQSPYIPYMGINVGFVFK